MIEQDPKEKVILRNPTIERVCDHPHLLPQLAQIYFQSWSKEGLCFSYQEALEKVSRFDPRQAFIVLDGQTPYALLNTLLTDTPDLLTLCQQFPTYHSVETASSKHLRVTHPTFRICFSITALPHYRVTDGNRDISLAQFLLKNPPTEDVYRLAYSRLSAVGMHEKFGALTVAILNQSRPEDLTGNGQNILCLYPKNPQQSAIFEQLHNRRLNYLPFLDISNAHIFTDILPYL